MAKDKDFFRIKSDETDSQSNQIDRRYRNNDTSDQWGFGGVTEKRIFQPGLRKVILYSFILIVLAGVIIGRLVQLQLVRGIDYKLLSEGNRIRTKVIDAPRGLIYDRNDKLLVANVPTFYLAFIAADLPISIIEKGKSFSSYPEIAKQLSVISDITGTDLVELNKIIDESSKISFRPKPLVDDISYENIVSLKTVLENWSGFEIGIRGSRYYPEGESVSHVLGYLGKLTEDDISNGDFSDYQFTDYTGKSGLEQEYENILRGQIGKDQVEINVRGQVQRIIEEKDPISGASVVLSIDVDIQNKLYEVLKAKLEELELEKATAIAIEPTTGEVLAAISLPSYDNNIFSKKIDPKAYGSLINNKNQPLFFRALQGEYPSGSTFKPVVALAALKNGVVTPNTTFLSTGGIKVNAWFFPDWQAGGHGVTNMVKALANSVNTYFYIIGGGFGNTVGLGVDRIVGFAKELYYTERLGIDFPSEADGFLPSRAWKEEIKQERWYIGDTYNISIGQGDVLVTPLQVTAMMSYMANGGRLYQPHFMKKILYPDGTVEYFNPVILQNDLADQKDIAVVREGLKAAVDWGSARSLNQFDPFEIAGKTGTAQANSTEEPHAWFTSFAPFDNPDIALTILIENGESSNHAVAVAREFYRWYIENYYQ